MISINKIVLTGYEKFISVNKKGLKENDKMDKRQNDKRTDRELT